MFVIVGLGNPGVKYALTRHNVGFWVIDELAARHGCLLEKVKFQAYYAAGHVAGNRTILAKPLTYMNRSGIAVGELVRYYDVALEKLLVIYDDMDLPVGRLRLRPGGGSGGHRGMASILSRLGTTEVSRLRLGIGRQAPAGEDRAVEHVLSRFSPEEEAAAHQAVALAADAVEVFLSRGLEEAMNRFNTKTPPQSPEEDPAAEDPEKKD